MNRIDTLNSLADMIAAIRLNHTVRVGIDGVDCSGKTMLADELVEPLRARGRNVIRISVDGFHNPREIRYRQGRGTPRGYYDDSFNLDAILEYVLFPLGPTGDKQYRTACYDFKTNASVDSPIQCAQGDEVLIFEGVFLHRAELLPHLDFTIFVDADFDVTLKRACTRDLCLFGTREDIEAIYRQRYIPGQRIYLAEQDPKHRATVVIHNNDICNPTLTMGKSCQQGAQPDAFGAG